MKELQQTKVLQAIAPAAIVDNAAFTSNVIDTRGLRYGEFHVNIGALDIAPSVFKVQEAAAKTNDTTLDTPSDVLDVSVKPAATDDNKIWIVGVDFTKRRERYLQLAVTGGDGAAGTYLSATFVGVMDGVVSSDKADRGVANAEYI